MVPRQEIQATCDEIVREFARLQVILSARNLNP